MFTPLPYCPTRRPSHQDSPNPKRTSTGTIHHRTNKFTKRRPAAKPQASSINFRRCSRTMVLLYHHHHRRAVPALLLLLLLLLPLLLLVSAAGAGRVAASSASPVGFLPLTPSSSVAPWFYTTTTARQQRSSLPSFRTLTRTSASRRGLVMSTSNSNNDKTSQAHQLPILKSRIVDQEEGLSSLIPPATTTTTTTSSMSRIKALVDSAPPAGSKSKKAATPTPSFSSTRMSAR